MTDVCWKHQDRDLRIQQRMSCVFGVVLEVLAERTLLGQKEYLVHWACTWEPAESIEGGEAHHDYVAAKQATEKKAKRKRFQVEAKLEEEEQKEHEEEQEEEEEEDNDEDEEEEDDSILEKKNATAARL